jgi:nitrate reductase NapE component
MRLATVHNLHINELGENASSRIDKVLNEKKQYKREPSLNLALTICLFKSKHVNLVSGFGLVKVLGL